MKTWLTNAANENQNVYYCFLDEKWVFTTSRRNKIKILPRAVEFETAEEGTVELPRMRSRTKPLKVMVIAVVGRPISGKFDGKKLDEQD